MRFSTSVEQLLRWKGYRLVPTKVRLCRACGLATVRPTGDVCASCVLWAAAEMALLGGQPVASERKWQ